MEINLAKLKMPSLSAQGLEALDLIASEDFSLVDIGKIIAKDAALSATLLKYANSPTYNPKVEITNVSRAVNTLGAKSVRAAIMIASMRGITDDNDKTAVFLSEHSQAVACISKLLAKKYHPDLADDVELAALIHDMGAMILAHNFPTEYTEVFDAVSQSPDELTISQTEIEFFGVNHDKVTEQFIKKTHLPQNLADITANFHLREPLCSINDRVSQQIALISLAHHIENKVNTHRVTIIETTPESLETLTALLGLSLDEIDNFIEDYDELLSDEE